MERDFCKALIENDREALSKIVNNYLNKLDAKATLQSKFERIKLWMETHECINAVEISREMLDSEPPVKEFIISLKDTGSKSKSSSIGIVVSKNKLSFSIK